MRSIGVAERRARLARRHVLAPSAKTDDVESIARALVGLHATDPCTMCLSATARQVHPSIASVEAALYAERTVVRHLAMRRTLFAFSHDVARLAHAACTEDLLPKQRKIMLDLIEASTVPTDPATWYAAASAATMDAVARRGSATTAQLTKDVAALAERFVLGEGTKWEGEQSASTRVLFLLSAEGHLARGRPKGSWVSSQSNWSTMESLVPGGITGADPTEAATELTQRWLRAFGPAPLSDLQWWTGWTKTKTAEALARAGAVEVDLAGAPAFLAADDLDAVEAPEPWVALLPALDPTTMGWQSREWYLGDHRAALFDRSGNAGPAVWVDGRIVGGWAQRADGEVVFRLLEDVGAEPAAAIADAAAVVQTVIGAARVRPRFPTPLLKELVS